MAIDPFFEEVGENGIPTGITANLFWIKKSKILHLHVRTCVYCWENRSLQLLIYARPPSLSHWDLFFGRDLHVPVRRTAHEVARDDLRRHLGLEILLRDVKHIGTTKVVEEPCTALLHTFALRAEPKQKFPRARNMSKSSWLNLQEIIGSVHTFPGFWRPTYKEMREFESLIPLFPEQ